MRTTTSVPRPIQYIEMDLRKKTTSEFRTVLDTPLGVPNSQVSLYNIAREGGGVLTLEVPLHVLYRGPVFKTTYGTLKLRSYIGGGLK